jgi:hypothetical protein
MDVPQHRGAADAAVEDADPAGRGRLGELGGGLVWIEHQFEYLFTFKQNYCVVCSA